MMVFQIIFLIQLHEVEKEKQFIKHQVPKFNEVDKKKIKKINC